MNYPATASGIYTSNSCCISYRQPFGFGSTNAHHAPRNKQRPSGHSQQNTSATTIAEGTHDPFDKNTMADADNKGREQPDFEAMGETMSNVGHATLELAMNLGKMRNVPALDGGAQILEELRAMRHEMADMQRTMMTRLEAA